MRTLLVVSVAGCMLAAAPNVVLAQQADRNPDSNPTAATVNQLLSTWQKTKENTVRRQIEQTLDSMGPPVAQPLASKMAFEFWQVLVVKEEEQQKHLDTVIIAAKILGRQGNAIARDNYAIEMLLAFTQSSKEVAGRAIKVSPEVRLAAIDALGRIFAQKAVFLVLQSPNDLTREKNKEALTAVEFLRNETQDHKKNITSFLVAMKNKETRGDKEAEEASPNAENAAIARNLLLATRNLSRKFKNYQKLGVIMGELEPPIGKDKDLNARIGEALSDIESNLRDAYAPPDGAKTATKPSAATIHAAAMAEQKAYELSDEMDDLAQRVDEWLEINDRTRKVILTFQILVRYDNSPQATYEETRYATLINYCAAEALGRVYGRRD